MTIEEIRKKAVPILQRHRIRRAGVFGSTARGEARATSDVDILVDLPDGLSLFDFVGIKLDLEDALKRKVDLVQYDTIKKRIRERVLADEVPIL
jgi:predicted nucleotidyltransferase